MIVMEDRFTSGAADGCIAAPWPFRTEHTGDTLHGNLRARV